MSTVAVNPPLVSMTAPDARNSATSRPKTAVACVDVAEEPGVEFESPRSMLIVRERRAGDHEAAGDDPSRAAVRARGELPLAAVSDERLKSDVSPADGLLDRVLHAVRDGGADLHHVNLAQPSLEDVYIHLTGRGLRE